MGAAIYTRVSSEEQIEGHSLWAQVELDRQFATQRGWQVAGIYEERGRSGKTALRPEFQRMMRDAASHHFDVVIVHKLDRFSRSIVDTMMYLKTLDQLGVSLVAVTENFDFTTPSGKMMMGMLALFAEMYIDNLSQETSKGKKERARKGGWNGTLPFGYTTVGRLHKMPLDLGEEFATQKLNEEDYSRLAALLEEHLQQYDGRVGENDAIICPINGPGVILAFEQYSLGIYSDLDIAQAMNAAGYRTNGSFGSNPFGKDPMNPMLQNRFYLGETSYQDKKKGAEKQYIPGRHEPILSHELFEKCQEVRNQRAIAWSRRASNKVATYLLASMLICAYCGSHLRGWHLRGDRRYRDPAKDRGVPCVDHVKSVLADEIESHAVEVLMRVDLPADWRERVLEFMAKDNPNYAQLRKQYSSLNGRLERLKSLFGMGDITEAEYKQGKADLKEQLGMLPLPIQGRMIDLDRAADLLGNVKGIW